MRQEISSKTQVWVVSFGLFLASLFLTAYSARYPAVARIGNSLVLEIVAPVSRTVESVRAGAFAILTRYVYLIETARENEQLLQRVVDLEARVGMLNEVERENARLREIVSFSADKKISGVVGSVIGGDPSGWIKGILVDKGSLQGVRSGMAVVSARGVVGQVVSVSSNSSRVLLVTDHSSGVDAIVEGSRARGVIEGGGENVCELKFVTKDVPVKVGEVVLTSGMDQVYQKGLVVGTVSRVSAASEALFQTITVKPAVDFSRLEEVLIVFAEKSAEIKAPVRRGS